MVWWWPADLEVRELREALRSSDELDDVLPTLDHEPLEVPEMGGGEERGCVLRRISPDAREIESRDLREGPGGSRASRASPGRTRAARERRWAPPPPPDRAPRTSWSRAPSRWAARPRTSESCKGIRTEIHARWRSALGRRPTRRAPTSPSARRGGARGRGDEGHSSGASSRSHAIRIASPWGLPAARSASAYTRSVSRSFGVSRRRRKSASLISDTLPAAPPMLHRQRTSASRTISAASAKTRALEDCPEAREARSTRNVPTRIPIQRLPSG